MARLNTFKIQFHSFGNGEHEFSFNVDDSFFTFFEEGEIGHGKVDIKVVLTKGIRQMQFDIYLDGWVEVACDLCLDAFNQDIKADYTLFGKFGEGNSEAEVDVIWFSDGDYEIDLASYIYEYIVLSLPMKKVHPDDPDGESGCDPDMLDRLNEMVYTSDE
jgi:uncharacterized metal-binding protein YceD (DUF177 family)